MTRTQAAYERERVRRLAPRAYFDALMRGWLARQSTTTPNDRSE